MFDWLRRRQINEKIEGRAKELTAEAMLCVAELSDKWKWFNKQLGFAPDTPLEKIMHAFSVPAQEFTARHYPALLQDGGKMFWWMLFSAIQASRTHSQEQLNKAVVELERYHAKMTD